MLLERLDIRVMKTTVGYMAFRRALLNWHFFPYRSLIQSNFDQSRAIIGLQVQVDSVDVDN